MRYFCLILLAFFLSFCVFAEDRLLYGIPSETDICLNREGFALGYSHKHRQAVWICYVLERGNLLREQVKRSNKFQPDPAISFRPVHPQDYSKTGYDRGHLAPAADMTYSLDTMMQSFFMSNISPQIPGCNRGIWKRIETQVRKWAVKEGMLYVITGPIFNSNGKTLGKTDIPIPEAFYKVVLDMTPPMKMIAFIVPNKSSKRRIPFFVVPVDEVESITGYDFFSTLEKPLQDQLEKQSSFSMW